MVKFGWNLPQRVAYILLISLLDVHLAVCFLYFPATLSVKHKLALKFGFHRGQFKVGPRELENDTWFKKKARQAHGPAQARFTKRIDLCSSEREEVQDFSRLNEWAASRGIIRSGWDVAYLPTFKTRGSLRELK